MYDPLVNAQLLPQQTHPNSYWAQSQPPQMPASATLPARCETVVIGGGYTGLNAALTLAGDYQREVTVLEANELAWGCSGRNAGFVMPATGRLGYVQWERKHGFAMAQQIHSEQQAALERIEALLAVDTPVRSLQQVARGGYLKLAHDAKSAALLASQHAMLQRLGDQAQLYDAQAATAFIRTPIAKAALHFVQSFGIQPLAFAAQTAHVAAQAGAKLCSHTSVLGWRQQGDDHILKTNRGDIRAKHVIIATNGYTPNHLHPSIHGRALPVLSSIMVTQPLSAAQQQAAGLSADHQFMDTRALKYYFRLLPDGRLLFGGRGAIHGRDAERPQYAQHLLAAARKTFPQLADALQVEYFWSGWISVALDDYPRVYSPAPGIFTSMGYCGAGVAFTSMAGKRLAQLSIGEPLPALPYYQSGLPKFPFAGLRRLGQWGYYQAAQLLNW